MNETEYVAGYGSSDRHAYRPKYSGTASSSRCAACRKHRLRYGCAGGYHGDGGGGHGDGGEDHGDGCEDHGDGNVRDDGGGDGSASVAATFHGYHCKW